MIDLNERSNNVVFAELLKNVSRIKELTWTQKAILLEVGYHDIVGISYKKNYANLIKELGSNRSTIKRAMKNLQDKGYILIPNSAYNPTSSIISLNFSKIPNI
jgi:DNA-binding MarR family transcriptional regulator